MLRRVASLSLIALALTACATDNRPSAEAIAKVIAAEDSQDAIDTDIAACMGEVMYESDLSDETLRNAVESDGKYFRTNNLPAADQKVLDSEEFALSFNKCLEPLLADTDDRITEQDGKAESGIVEGEENPSDPSGGKTKPSDPKTTDR